VSSAEDNREVVTAMWWVILFVVLVLAQASVSRWAWRRTSRPIAGATIRRADPCLGPVITPGPPPLSAEGTLARRLLDGDITPERYRRATA
jgi:hypothetical protein